MQSDRSSHHCAARSPPPPSASPRSAASCRDASPAVGGHDIVGHHADLVAASAHDPAPPVRSSLDPPSPPPRADRTCIARLEFERADILKPGGHAVPAHPFFFHRTRTTDCGGSPSLDGPRQRHASPRPRQDHVGIERAPSPSPALARHRGRHEQSAALRRPLDAGLSRIRTRYACCDCRGRGEAPAG